MCEIALYRKRIQSILRSLHIPDFYETSYGLTLQLEAQPSNLVSIGNDIHGRPQRLLPEATKRWFEMKSAAESDDVYVEVVSAFRSVDYQVGIIQRKLDQGDSITDILKVIAAPGFSEHHTGRALDLSTPDYRNLTEEFETTDAFLWLVYNAAEFMFKLTYPRDCETKITYEPWHWAYCPSC